MDTSDDNFSLFDKKSVIRIKYRPLFLKNTDQKHNSFSENADENLKMF